MAEAQPARILNVDDSEERLRYRTSVLRADGFDVIEARSGAAAIDAASRERPSLVLLDVHLPDIDGFDVCLRLKQANAVTASIPVLHITAALREDEHWIRALRAGSAGFLREPVSDDVLCEVIRTLVRQNEERQSIESQLRQSHKLEALGLLSAGIAHDFNNTLTVILGLTDMLTSQIGPDLPLGRDLAEIQDAANHAARLTRQLLAFSKEQPQRLDFIDVNAVVGDAARTFERIVGETVRLTVVLSPGTCVVRADKTHLLQVLLNLVGNARDAMPDGGTLAIETARVSIDDQFARLNPPIGTGDFIRISVSDTGHGMTEEVQRRIFDPFYTTKPVGRGTGLGLSTVYGITKQLGGYIFVDSAVGSGTRFDLYFADASVVVEPRPQRAPVRVPDNAYTVLVVEDDRSVRAMTAGALRRHGYRVVEAETPVQALLLGREALSTVDLLLTDVVMPGLSGRTLAARLLADHPRLEVIYMSGYLPDVSESRVASPDRFLRKPFTASQLLNEVADALAARPEGGGRVVT